MEEKELIESGWYTPEEACKFRILKRCNKEIERGNTQILKDPEYRRLKEWSGW